MAMASERVYVGGSDARGGGGEPVDGANFVFVCVVVGQGRAREREGPAGSRSSGGGGGGEAARGMSPGSARARAARTAQNTAWRAILLHGGKAPCERRRRRQSSHGSLAVLCHGCARRCSSVTAHGCRDERRRRQEEMEANPVARHGALGWRGGGAAATDGVGRNWGRER
uniref:Uncharacterized protein n=1 Tax=Oryza glumipatula TaxID=40148 RepID=A0A0D9Y597_9ORYZ